jgi:hypothetical protein
MRGFKYRQAYAILEKRIDAGELPRGTYKFVMGLNTVTPRVQGASLTPAQAHSLDNIVTLCTYTPTARAA